MPEQQGSLDCLCSLYSIINAISHVCNLSKKDNTRLFRRLIRVLEQRGEVARVLLEGAGVKLLQIMLKTASQHMARQHGLSLCITPVFRKKDITDMHIDVFWKQLQQILGSQRSAIILGLQGKHEHWTCAIAIAEKVLWLEDSDHLALLKKQRCRIGNQELPRYQCLNPAEVWAISLS